MTTGAAALHVGGLHVGGLHVVGVRHHSPACARLVGETIDAVRPAHVLVEGPADFSDRIGELLLGHTLPVAIFSYLRGPEGPRLSWSPLCDHSPEWVAISRGHAVGARVRFIDLPAWHPAFGAREHRYADAERRYAEVTARLCRMFAVDDVDVLWDHMVESQPSEGLAQRLSVYFDLVRGEAEADPSDAARESYMARWVRAAVRAGDGPVVVVCGGFHRPALLRAAAGDDATAGWPEVPRPPAGSAGGSYLVPYSHARLDAFTGYQAGMPSPAYYQRLWEEGPRAAASGLVADVVGRLRARHQVVSTADLIAARALADGLAAMRGHEHPTRTDVLDGLVGALVSDALEQALPWSARGPLAPGAHPVVVEMVAALTGERTGTLHSGTPAPPLLPAVTAELAALGLAGSGPVRLDLTDEAGLRRSRVLHRLRVLGVPGFDRLTGPAAGEDPLSAEEWRLRETDVRIPALVEAAAWGATLPDAASAALLDRAGEADGDVGPLAEVLFDAALCGLDELSGRLGAAVARGVADARELGAAGRALATALGLWRHDRLLGAAGSPLVGEVVEAAARRVLWLAEGVRGGPAPADPERLEALAALRDAVRHAGPALGLAADPVLAAGLRIAGDRGAPPDLRGAGLGLCRALGAPVAPGPQVPRDPVTLGDWLAGLFALAREEVLADPALLTTLDEVVGSLTDHDFLVALPALRQAFAFFPPVERETLAAGVLRLRGVTGSARALLRLRVDPVVAAEGAALDAAVDRALARCGLEEAP
ncbi:MAG TPA: DUF5682 family protein [Pseudonocardia sp.]|nr:DUF5682 family protein [Pseudonocardia sp.]